MWNPYLQQLLTVVAAVVLLLLVPGTLAATTFRVAVNGNELSSSDAVKTALSELIDLPTTDISIVSVGTLNVYQVMLSGTKEKLGEYKLLYNLTAEELYQKNLNVMWSDATNPTNPNNEAQTLLSVTRSNGRILALSYTADSSSVAYRIVTPPSALAPGPLKDGSNPTIDPNPYGTPLIGRLEYRINADVWGTTVWGTESSSPFFIGKKVQIDPEMPDLSPSSSQETAIINFCKQSLSLPATTNARLYFGASTDGIGGYIGGTLSLESSGFLFTTYTAEVTAMNLATLKSSHRSDVGIMCRGTSSVVTGEAPTMTITTSTTSSPSSLKTSISSITGVQLSSITITEATTGVYNVTMSDGPSPWTAAENAAAFLYMSAWARKDLLGITSLKISTSSVTPPGVPLAPPPPAPPAPGSENIGGRTITKTIIEIPDRRTATKTLAPSSDDTTAITTVTVPGGGGDNVSTTNTSNETSATNETDLIPTEETITVPTTTITTTTTTTTKATTPSPKSTTPAPTTLPSPHVPVLFNVSTGTTEDQLKQALATALEVPQGAVNVVSCYDIRQAAAAAAAKAALYYRGMAGADANEDHTIAIGNDNNTDSPTTTETKSAGEGGNTSSAPDSDDSNSSSGNNNNDNNSTSASDEGNNESNNVSTSQDEGGVPPEGATNMTTENNNDNNDTEGPNETTLATETTEEKTLEPSPDSTTGEVPVPETTTTTTKAALAPGDTTLAPRPAAGEQQRQCRALFATDELAKKSISLANNNRIHSVISGMAPAEESSDGGKKSSLPIGIIAGAAGGAVVVIAAIIAVCCCCCKNRGTKRAPDEDFSHMIYYEMNAGGSETGSAIDLVYHEADKDSEVPNKLRFEDV